MRNVFLAFGWLSRRYFESKTSIICSGISLLAIIREFGLIIAVNKHSSRETGEMKEIAGRMQDDRLLYSKIS